MTIFKTSIQSECRGMGMKILDFAMKKARGLLLAS